MNKNADWFTVEIITAPPELNRGGSQAYASWLVDCVSADLGLVLMAESKRD